MTRRRHSARDLVLGGIATLVAVTATFAVMGPPTTFLCLALIAALSLGLALGLVAALTATRFIKSFLFGVGATDPLIALRQG